MYDPDAPVTPAFEPNEMHPELLAAAALHPFPGCVSSPRMQMFLSHFGQTLVIADPTPRRLYTGVEREFGRFTFNIKMPADGQIIAVIDRIQPTMGQRLENPETMVIYENEHTREIDIFSIPRYHSLHQHFGFSYVYNHDAIRKLYEGSNIAEGTVFAESPMVTPEGEYCYGRETNVVFLNIPGVIEDGVIASKSFLKKVATKGYETRTMSFGKKFFPLNLYGDENNYKPFPDIGEYTRKDGLLFGRREYNSALAPVEMSPSALRSPDYTYDDLTYTLVGEAKIIDISVMRDGSGGVPPTPTGMETQPAFYHERLKEFYTRILKEDDKLFRNRGDALKRSMAYHRLVVDAKITLADTSKQKIERLYKLKPLDDWRVEVTFEYDITPTEAFKLTGTHGNKGVIVDEWEDEDMPVDDFGNRAELVFGPQAVSNRMIPAAPYEQYINATSQYVTRLIREQAKGGLTPEVVDSIWNLVTKYYKIISPPRAQLLLSDDYLGSRESHIQSILRDPLGVRIWYPPNNPVEITDALRQLHAEIPVPMSPVTYKGRSGNIVRTKVPVLVGSMYIMLLEKTGSDFSGVGSSKLQLFGMPARLTNFDKYSAPVRPQPGRITDEATVRLLSSTIGGEAVAELLEASNDPSTHKYIVDKLLRAKQPTNLEQMIDRTMVMTGKSRPHLIVNHVLECQGIEFAYLSDADQPPTIYYPEEK